MGRRAPPDLPAKPPAVIEERCVARFYALKLSGKPDHVIETATSMTEAYDVMRDSMLMKLSGKPYLGCKQPSVRPMMMRDSMLM